MTSTTTTTALIPSTATMFVNSLSFLYMATEAFLFYVFTFLDLRLLKIQTLTPTLFPLEIIIIRLNVSLPIKMVCEYTWLQQYNPNTNIFWLYN